MNDIVIQSKKSLSINLKIAINNGEKLFSNFSSNYNKVEHPRFKLASLLEKEVEDIGESGSCCFSDGILMDGTLSRVISSDEFIEHLNNYFSSVFLPCSIDTHERDIKIFRSKLSNHCVENVELILPVVFNYESVNAPSKIDVIQEIFSYVPHKDLVANMEYYYDEGLYLKGKVKIWPKSEEDFLLSLQNIKKSECLKNYSIESLSMGEKSIECNMTLVLNELEEGFSYEDY